MRKGLKSFAMVLSIAMLISMASTGCGGGSKGGEAAKTASVVAPGESSAAASTAQGSGEQLPKQKGYDVKKELQAYDDLMPISSFVDYGAMQPNPDDLTVLWMRDNLKIDMGNLEVNPSGSYADKVRARLAANDLPDMLMCFDRGLFQSIANSGNFLDMEELLKNYAPDVTDFISWDILNRYKSNDGKLYLMVGNTLPLNDLNTYAYAQEGAVLNMEVLKATGLQVPQTPDGLYAYLKAAAGQKSAKGKKIIPFAYNAFLPESYRSDNYPIASKKLMHMFEPGTGYYFLTKNDGVKTIDLHYDRPSYVTFLKYFSMLYREKLMDRDIFTISADQYRERIKDGVYGYLWGGAGEISPANSAIGGKADYPYEPVAMPKDASFAGQNSKAIPLSVLGNWYFLFNKNIKDPARLAKFLNWQYTLEGVQVVNYGAPDKEKVRNNWYYDDSGKVVIDMELQKKWDSEKYGWAWQDAGGWGIHAAGLKPCIKYTAVNEMGVCMADDFYIKQDKVASPDLFYDPAFEAMTLQPFGPWFEKSGPSLNDVLNKWEVKIISSAKNDAEVDTMYAQMMAEAKKVGYDDMKKELYQNYQAANK